MGAAKTLDQLVAATERLVATAQRLPLVEVSRPSGLPGWSRGSVLTHLARNADGFRNFLLGARSGEVVRMYASSAARDLDVGFGAKRPPGRVIEDFIFSSRNLLTDIGSTSPDVLSASAVHARGTDDGPVIPVASSLLIRLSEVEIHHVDLQLRYSFADSPIDVLEVLIARCIPRLSEFGMPSMTYVATDSGSSWSADDAGGEAVVSGSASELLGWLTRRTEGINLDIVPAGPLPSVPSMG